MRLDIRRLGCLLTTCALLGVTTAAIADNWTDDWAGDGGVPAFYRWDGTVPARPGTMLRTETAPAEVSIPAAGRAERILYSSTDWRDPARAATVSGIVFLPKGEPPKGGWPVLAWAHGTTGIADVCAPSFLPRSPRDTQYLGYWLDHGYAIVATDYVGLGTPGVHPYLQYRAEGISVLDGIRAALARYPALNPAKIVTMGQSQGSEGAIAAAYLAPSYAPELNIRGTVATGLVAHTEKYRRRRAASDPEKSIWMRQTTKIPPMKFCGSWARRAPPIRGISGRRIIFPQAAGPCSPDRRHPAWAA